MNDLIINTRTAVLTSGETIELEHEYGDHTFGITKAYLKYMKWSPKLRQERTVSDTWDKPLKLGKVDNQMEHEFTYVEKIRDTKDGKVNDGLVDLLKIDSFKHYPINLSKVQVALNPELKKYKQSS